MTARRRPGSLLGLLIATACACQGAPSARPKGDHMSEYKLTAPVAGASRLYLGPGTKAIVAEHRDWLHEAFHERDAEAPGVVKLLGADGAVAHAASGWALGGPLADGSAAWVEEVGDEYHYRIARSTGPAAPLSPPDDFWAVAGAAGHAVSAVGAVVLWRPVPGASSNLPDVRRDELWIASIDRKAGTVLNTRLYALTLPWDRQRGVLIGGPPGAPILLLVGLPDPGGPGAYRAVGLKLPSLEVAWEAKLDVAAAELAAAAAPSAAPAGRASEPPPPAATLTAESLRTFYGVMGGALGDGTGWLVASGHLLRSVLSIEHPFLVFGDGKTMLLSDLHLPSSDGFGMVADEPAVLVKGVVGGRYDAHFDSISAVWPGARRVQTLADQRTEINGHKLGDSPDLIPMSAAMRGGVLYVAPPIGGAGTGADSADVRGLLTTPATWHQADRPRVIARQQWLEARARP
ncbi:MAG TPA: hypothetical protein VFT22_05645 [Kofleriaceae bacterium]|nr:hypothetical protein [Kofleriaceae bacterium]